MIKKFFHSMWIFVLLFFFIARTTTGVITSNGTQSVTLTGIIPITFSVPALSITNTYMGNPLIMTYPGTTISSNLSVSLTSNLNVNVPSTNCTSPTITSTNVYVYSYTNNYIYVSSTALAPFNLTGVAGSNSILYSWQNPTGLKTNLVLRAPNIILALLENGESNYLDTGLSPSTTYTAAIIGASADLFGVFKTLQGPITSVYFTNRVNCGGPYITNGNWLADLDEPASENYTNTFIGGTAPMQVYQSVLYPTGVPSWGNILTNPVSISIKSGLTNTAGTLILHFSEPYWTSAGSRIFDVSVQGSIVDSALDVYVLSGGLQHALDQSFPFTFDSSGNLSITFSNRVNYALINGYEVLVSSVKQSTPGIFKRVLNGMLNTNTITGNYDY